MCGTISYRSRPKPYRREAAIRPHKPFLSGILLMPSPLRRKYLPWPAVTLTMSPRSWLSISILGAIAMTDQPSTTVQAQVRSQFDRQVAHYGRGSAMADLGLLELIVRMAGPTAGLRA
jgi:hypothetical protein